jgi:hypothetical protein
LLSFPFIAMKFFIITFLFSQFFYSNIYSQILDLALINETDNKMLTPLLANKKRDVLGDEDNYKTLKSNFPLNASLESNATYNLNDFITIETSEGASNYCVETENQKNGEIHKYYRGSSSNTIKLEWLKGLEYGNSYIIKVHSLTNGEWVTNSEAFEISLVSTLPVIALDDTFCGSTGIGLGEKIYTTNASGANEFHWKIENTELNYFTEKHLYSKNNSIPLSDFENLKKGYTYSIAVRAKINGEWTQFGENCSVTIANNTPLIQKNGSDCKNIELAIDKNIYCSQVTEATNYHWVFKDIKTNNEFSYTNSVNYVSLKDIDGLKSNGFYTVKVQPKTNDTWQQYGQETQLVVLSVDTNKLTDF